MTKRMLIDASHAEETRVVVLDGNRLEDFDVETATKRQLKGNIYLAKVVRVEPSLQAAFVEYGGNRHGFLAFGEIHPDYYQIPVADRQRLIEAQEAEAREDEAAEDAFAAGDASGAAGAHSAAHDEDAPEGGSADGPYVPPEPAEHASSEDARTEDGAPSAAEMAGAPPGEPADPAAPPRSSSEDDARSAAELIDSGSPAQPLAIADETISAPALDYGQGAPEEAADLFAAEAPADAEPVQAETDGADLSPESREPAEDGRFDHEASPEAPPPESLGGESEPRERQTPRFLRNYKIQEVIRRRQILLVQIVKEERGSKGAALTTYISLAGRYSVLMPNSPRGGGISRKITSAADRRRLKEVTSELQLPRGMGMIVRTAGAARPKAEILRDGEYLLTQWDQIRELTMQSVAPALIYEEANLIKRTIRDVYSRDIDDILVDGEAGWRHARDFMRMLMPAHARKVQLWREGQPLFAKMQVEAQLDGMLQPVVQLRSGGYLVINQTEALVAIDVNSGRSTRERGIEETALRTNMEAAAEVARQLRLRDLAGLIVIDFIDMEQRRHNAMVERELKDALRLDRARIQVGSISHFGLLEMSRQRLRPSLAETAFAPCPQCGGTGHVRGTESAALYVLRAVEEEGAKRKAAEIVVHVSGAIALYVLNHKRARLGEIEARYGMTVAFAPDETLRPPEVRIERVRAQTAPELPAPVSQGNIPDARYAAIDAADALAEETPDEMDDDEAETPDEEEGSAAAGTEAERRRRRRRRRGGRRDDVPATAVLGTEPAGFDAPDGGAAPADAVTDAEPAAAEEPAAEPAEPSGDLAEGGEAAKRRGRRGGRRRRREPAGAEGIGESAPDAVAEDVPMAPAWTGPTPADPFGGPSFDIYDAMELAEQQHLASQAAPDVPEPQHLTAEAANPSPDAVELAASEPVTSEPRGQSIMPDLEPSTEPPPPPTPDLPVEEPLPWTTPEVEPPTEPAAPEAVESEAVREPELALSLAEPAPPAEKRRGWWRR